MRRASARRRPGSASMPSGTAQARAGPGLTAVVPSTARAVAAIRAVGFHRPSCTAISQPSSRSRDITRPASAVLPIPPIPVSTTPLAAPNRRPRRVRRRTPIAARIWARRPISAPIGRSRTSLPPGGVVAMVSGHLRGAGSTSGPSLPAASRVATPYSGAGAVLVERECCSSARYRARASACPAGGPGARQLPV